jgi:hypothetical protein
MDTELCLTLPEAGLMLNGRLYEHQNLGCPSIEKGYSFLPSPKASDGFHLQFSKEQSIKMETRGKFEGDTIIHILKILDVPLSRFPNIYEWMMGFPLNYLKLRQQSKDMETPLRHPLQDGSESE